jgi:hypothetical protein
LILKRYIVVNAGCADKDIAHINKHLAEFRKQGKDVTLENFSEQNSLIAGIPLLFISPLAPALPLYQNKKANITKRKSSLGISVNKIFDCSTQRVQKRAQ